MACLLPDGSKRPVLDVTSPFLIYIWNVPDNLQPMEIKKIAQSHKFGRVRFVETFEAWHHKKIGQIIVEFQDAAGLDKFVDALSKQEVLRFNPPLEFQRLDPRLGSAQFFGFVKTWSGVDLIACDAIPPTFHYRTPMPPKASSSPVHSSALSYRRPTIGEGHSAPAAVVGQRPPFPSARRRPFGGGSGERFDHGEDSEADSPVRGLTEKDEQVPGGGAAAAAVPTFKWEGRGGHPVAGRGTSFGQGTARANAFVGAARQSEVPSELRNVPPNGSVFRVSCPAAGFGGAGRGFHSGFAVRRENQDGNSRANAKNNSMTAAGNENNNNVDQTGTGQSSRPILHGGFGRGRAGLPFGHGCTLGSSNYRGRAEAPTLAPVIERGRERRPLTIRRPSSMKENHEKEGEDADRSKNAEEEAVQRQQNGKCKEENGAQEMKKPNGEDNDDDDDDNPFFDDEEEEEDEPNASDKNGNSTTNSSSPELLLLPGSVKASPSQQFRQYRQPVSIGSQEEEAEEQQRKTLTIRNLEPDNINRVLEVLQFYWDIDEWKELNPSTVKFVFAEATDAEMAVVQLRGHAVLGTDARFELGP